MELKSRLAAIIKEVVDTEAGIPIVNILSRYSITKRTFYYDLEVINKWLLDKNFGIAKISNQLLFIKTKKATEIKKELEACQYYYSIQERKTIELFCIALSNKSVNINQFQTYFDVSKNTIASDIRELKQEFNYKEIALYATAKQGYLLQGEEFAIREKLGAYYNQLHTYYSTTREDVRKFLQETLVSLTQQEIDFFEVARCLIKQYEMDIQSQLYTGYIDYECTMIVISWIRSFIGNIVSINEYEKDTLRITKSYASVIKNSDKLRKYGLIIPDNEVYYLTSLLLGIRTAQFSSQEQETLFIYEFVHQLIAKFEIIACIQLSDKEQLAIRLRSHIRPFYYRLKYGLHEEHALTSQIKDMYPEVFDFCSKAIKDINSDISDMMGEDEISYLTVYFIGKEKETYSDVVSIPKVLVISENGRAESDLLIEQLKDILGVHFIFETAQYHSLKTMDVTTYSLIITTVKSQTLMAMGNKVVVVKTILGEEEYTQMILALSTQGISYKDDKFIQMLIENVKRNVPVSFNANKLYLDFFKSLRSFLHYRYAQTKNYSFANLIANKKYSYMQGEVLWKSVLYNGYSSVYGEEIATTKTSNEQVRIQQGNYLYNITNTIVLVYCNDYMLIQEESVAIVITKQELIINDNHKGNMFIFFGCRNDYEHFKYLKNIYDYCLNLDDKDVQKLIN